MKKHLELKPGQALLLKPAQAKAYGYPLNAAPIFIAYQERKGYSRGFIIAEFDGKRGYYRESDFK